MKCSRIISTGIICVFMVISLFSIVFPDVSLAERRLVKMGAGAAQGVWYVFATGYTEYLRKNSDIEATVIPAGGGMECFRNVMTNKVDFGFTMASTAYGAWNGLPPFREKNRDFRSIGIVSPASTMHIVVRKDSGINTIYDLKGKRFSPGPIGAVSYSTMLALLNQLGMKDDVRIVNLNHTEMMTYLADKKLDGFALMGAAPNPTITETSSTTPVKLIDLRKVFQERDFFKENPFFVQVTIPAGIYHGVDYEVVTFGDPVPFIAHKDVSEKLVYDVTRLLFSPEGVKYLVTVHKALAEMGTPNPTQGIVVPLHVGAEKYWKEKGVAIKADSGN